jgi:hypothetical protein
MGSNAKGERSRSQGWTPSPGPESKARRDAVIGTVAAALHAAGPEFIY